MLYLGTFDQKYFIWVFLGKNFKNTIVIFEISTRKFVFLQNFTKQHKSSNFGPKMPELGVLELGLENNMVVFEISTPEYD